MNKMPNITAALLAAHTVWKVRGVQSRPLLNVLIKLDDGRFLEPATRELVQNDHQAFVYVRCSRFSYDSLISNLPTFFRLFIP